MHYESAALSPDVARGCQFTNIVVTPVDLPYKHRLIWVRKVTRAMSSASAYTQLQDEWTKHH